MIRSLLETGSRVGAFCQLGVEDLSFAELEVRVRDKAGFVFPSPRGGAYSRQRLQQIVKELAAVAGIIRPTQKGGFPLNPAKFEAINLEVWSYDDGS